MNFNDELTYRLQTASEKDLYQHLCLCKENFIPPLDVIVNIKDFASKIANLSKTFEVWNEDNLVGLIAAYFNNHSSKIGYITNVSVINQFMGLGLSTNLLNLCIQYAKENNFFSLELEVHQNNKKAIGLYTAKGFEFIPGFNASAKVKMRLNIVN